MRHYDPVPRPSIQLTEDPDDCRWRAVVERDARVDGAFVNAVTTTGVFCRPSCCASSRFYEASKGRHGMTATQLRKGGQGVEIRYAFGESELFELPLDVRGTAFQERVWRTLHDLPAGKTASYKEIAARIGQPKSARAVAGACAANPVAVIIPCHRVVRANGDLSGYRWGIGRKRQLLDRESTK